MSTNQSTASLNLSWITEKFFSGIKFINDGFCMDWAVLAHDRLPNSTLYAVFSAEKNPPVDIGHAFLEVNGKFYDSDHPAGTSIRSIVKDLYPHTKMSEIRILKYPSKNAFLRDWPGAGLGYEKTTPSSIALADLGDVFRKYKYVHLTPYDFGEEFVAKPAITEAPYTDDGGNVIEDTTTPRVSFSTNLDGAIEALAGKAPTAYVVYGTNTLNGFVDPSKDCKFSGEDGNKYGIDFSSSKYRKTENLTTKEFRDRLKYCVPDAELTGEVWATKPTKLVRIGYVSDTGKPLTEREKFYKIRKREPLSAAKETRTMKVYRLQSSSGKGPLEYYEDLLDQDFTTEQLKTYLKLTRIPDKYEHLDGAHEWNAKVLRLLDEGKAIFGTKSLAQLYKWFPEDSIRKLKKFGLRVVEFDVPKDNVFDAKSGTQVIFIKPNSTKASAINAGKNKPAKRYTTFAGLSVGIEYDIGDRKSGKYTQWYPYGFIKNTKAEDGGSVDVFLGPNEHASHVYIVKQLKKDGTQDEDKVMLGFSNEENARNAYLGQYPLSFYGGMDIVPMTDFKSRYLDQFRTQTAEFSGKTEQNVLIRVHAQHPIYTNYLDHKKPYDIVRNPYSGKKVSADVSEVTAEDNVSPDEYRKEHGKCPHGYNWNGEKCVEVSKDKPQSSDDGKESKTSEFTEQAKKTWNSLVATDNEIDKTLDTLLPDSIKAFVGDAKVRQERKKAARQVASDIASDTGKYITEAFKAEGEDYKKAFNTIKKLSKGEKTTIGEKLQLGVQAGSAAYDIASVISGIATFGAGTVGGQAAKIGVKQGIKQAAKRILTKEGSSVAVKAAAKYAAKKVAKKAAAGALLSSWNQYKKLSADSQKGLVRKLSEKYLGWKIKNKGAKESYDTVKKDLRNLRHKKQASFSYDFLDTAFAVAAGESATEDEALNLLYMDFVNEETQKGLDEFSDQDPKVIKDQMGKEIDSSPDLGKDLLSEKDLESTEESKPEKPAQEDKAPEKKSNHEFVPEDIPPPTPWERTSQSSATAALLSVHAELTRRGNTVLADELKDPLLKKLFTLDNFQDLFRVGLEITKRMKSQGTPGRKILETIRVLLETGSEILADRIAGEDDDLRDSIKDAGLLFSSLVRKFGKNHADFIFDALAEKILRKVGNL